jgi:hypothetical protein
MGWLFGRSRLIYMGSCLVSVRPKSSLLVISE